MNYFIIAYNNLHSSSTSKYSIKNKYRKGTRKYAKKSNKYGIEEKI
jgi:hypothetical protein